jgi:Na+-transporting methylmalonyl-CoA/oxaloacetate decarboxylase gamma subunit
MANTMLMVFMGLAIVLLFAVMVISAMASSAATDSPSECQDKCHRYSMYSALVTGLTVVVLIIALIIYIYASREEISGGIADSALAVHEYMKPQAV